MAGKDILTNQASNMPQMHAFVSWFRPITFKRLTTTIVDFENVPVEQSVSTKGVIQPLTIEQLRLKPEEQRSWKWLQLHCLADVKLTTNDKIVFSDVKYRVMADKDYSLNNYMEYHLVEDYEDG